jgi:hypothetical protein
VMFKILLFVVFFIFILIILVWVNCQRKKNGFERINSRNLCRILLGTDDDADKCCCIKGIKIERIHYCARCKRKMGSSK